MIMKNLSLLKRVSSIVLSIFLTSLCSITFAQGINAEVIYDYHPNAGYVGDTVTVTGTTLTTIQTVKIGETEATIVSGATDSELKFLVPDLSNNVEQDTLTFVFDDNSTMGSLQPFLQPQKSNDNEEIIFYENCENVPFGGSEASGHYEYYDKLTFSGNAPRGWRGPAVVAEYQGASKRGGFELTNANDAFIISDINTSEYNDVRFSFAMSLYGWYALAGSMKAAYSIDGGATYVPFGAGSFPYAVDGKLKEVRLAESLPASESLSIKLWLSSSADKAIFIDDFKLTGVPKGLGDIESFTPIAQKVGKEVTVKGQGFAGATAVMVGDIAVTDFTVSVDGETVTFTVPAGADVSGENSDGVIAINITAQSGFEIISRENLTVNAAAPSITSMSPSSGPVDGLIYIEGDNLYNLESISFGGASAVDFTSVSDGKLEVYVPDGAQTGKVIIKTENAIDAVVSADDFTIDATFPLISIVASATEGVEGDEIDITIETSTAVSSDVSATLTTSGTANNDDFTLSETTLTIVSGQTASGVSKLTLVDEGDKFEQEETLVLTVSDRVGEGAVIGRDRTKEIAIQLPVVNSLDLEEISRKLSIHASNNVLKLAMAESANIDEAQVSIYGLDGRLRVATFTAIQNGKVSLSTKNSLSNGVYILRLVTNQKIYVKRFFYQN